MTNKLNIVLVRRGYSPTGGAEAYLRRLADGIIKAGHDLQLIGTEEWPRDQWSFGSKKRLSAKSAIGFADELEQIRPQLRCDVLFSFERVWRCDVYRAGDGVHRAWLARRRKFEIPLKQFVRAVSLKHRDLLRLEESLLAARKAGRVIVASQMVRNEITEVYGYPTDKIDLVRNGVPLDRFRFDPELREKSRAQLNLKQDQIALLFAGSGWERKGLLFAIEAMALCQDRKLRLLVRSLAAPGGAHDEYRPCIAVRYFKKRGANAGHFDARIWVAHASRVLVLASRRNRLSSDDFALDAGELQ